MKLTTAITIPPLLAAALTAPAVGAGSLDPGLQSAVAGMAPGDKVDVIVRCADPLDPATVAPSELVPALRNRGRACENSLTAALEAAAAAPPTSLWIINGVAARVPVASLRGLARRAGVETVYLNETVELPPAPELASLPADPAFTYWNISEVRAPDLWALGHYGSGAVVASMDTGVDAAHADLAPQWRGGANSWYDPNGEHATPWDADGHGTQVMGLMVGGNAGGFDVGVAPDARWIAVKIFNDAGWSDLAKIHQGFQWLLDPDGDPATDDKPDVVNGSWVLQGTEERCGGEFAADLVALKALGIAAVFAAGNSGPQKETSMEPANDPAALSVGALDYALRVPRFSSRGPSACDGGIYPRLAAPGKDVLTTGLTDGGYNPTAYAFGTGTSFASPHVAGAVALLKSAVPSATAADIEAALQAGALDLGDLGPDNDSGAGLVDVVESYFLLADGAPPPPVDTDQDRVPDGSDLCPGTPAGEAADADGCSASQLDGDGDGVSDALDQCPGTPPGTAVGADGCPLIDPDSDGDGVSDALDQCPGTPPGTAVGADGCPLIDPDSDGDGVGDALDQCPGTPPGTAVDAVGCPLSTANQPPTAVDDSAVASRGSSLRFNLTGNDHDPDGAIDPDTLAIVDPPKQASVTVHRDGSGDVTITLSGKSKGERSFSYTVADEQGAVSNPATVTVGVN